jgi:hypothetical protein
MPQVAERQVPRAILSDDHCGPLPKRASVVVAAKDQALVGCNRFQLLPRKRRELQRPRFAFLVDLGRDSELESAAFVVLRHSELL